MVIFLVINWTDKIDNDNATNVNILHCLDEILFGTTAIFLKSTE